MRVLHRCALLCDVTMPSCSALDVWRSLVVTHRGGSVIAEGHVDSSAGDWHVTRQFCVALPEEGELFRITTGMGIVLEASFRNPDQRRVRLGSDQFVARARYGTDEGGGLRPLVFPPNRGRAQLIRVRGRAQCNNFVIDRLDDLDFLVHRLALSRLPALHLWIEEHVLAVHFDDFSRKLEGALLIAPELRFLSLNFEGTSNEFLEAAEDRPSALARILAAFRQRGKLCFLALQGWGDLLNLETSEQLASCSFARCLLYLDVSWCPQFSVACVRALVSMGSLKHLMLAGTRAEKQAFELTLTLLESQFFPLLVEMGLDKTRFRRTLTRRLDTPVCMDALVTAAATAGQLQPLDDAEVEGEAEENEDGSACVYFHTSDLTSQDTAAFWRGCSLLFPFQVVPWKGG